MSRRNVRRRPVRSARPVRQRAPREARSIAKDNSVIGVLSFVGAFLFLLLIGIMFIGSDRNDSYNYEDEFAYNDNKSVKPKSTSDRSKNREPKEKTAKDTEKVEEKPDNSNEAKKPEEKLAKDTNEKDIESKQEGVRGLLPQQLSKKNPNKNSNDLNLSADEQYRIAFERAKRSGNISKLTALAKWCEEKDMTGRAEDVYRHIINIQPNHTEAREALGYIRLGGTWAKEEDAAQLGYYKYKDKYVSAKWLKKKGLYLHEGEWITKTDVKKKGLVIHEDNVMTKEELKELKKRKKEEEQKRKTAQREQEREQEREQRRIDYSKQLTLSFRQIRIYTPPTGKWSLTSSGRSAQAVSTDPIVNNGASGALKDTLIDSEHNIVLKVQGYSPEILYTFSDGSAAQGSEIRNLMKAFRGEAFNQYQRLRFQKERRTRYGYETFTQQLGVGVDGKREVGILLTFFRYGTLTYAIRLTYPIPDNKKDNKIVQQKINYLFSNMKKLRNNY